MSASTLPTTKMVSAYWLPEVGIGPAYPPPPVLPDMQTVVVPLTDILKFTRPDGSPQINVVNLMGATFTQSTDFNPPYLDFAPNLLSLLENGEYKSLQKAGIKIVLTILGNNGYGWSSIPPAKIQPFVNYLNETFIHAGYHLDGIDVDNEYAILGHTLTETIRTMHETFTAGTIISKALYADLDEIPDIKDYLTFGGIMNYGNSASLLEYYYGEYRNKGMSNEQLSIGVNAGPIEQGGSFTSVETTRELTNWQPADGQKRGMMIWSFSQDIQQFTASPQNQVSLVWPNSEDHEWQRAIIEEMTR